MINKLNLGDPVATRSCDGCYAHEVCSSSTPYTCGPVTWKSSEEKRAFMCSHGCECYKTPEEYHKYLSALLGKEA